MPSLILAPVFAAVLAVAPARAQDGSLDDLLNRIPDIENAAAEEAQAPEVPDKPFTEYVDEVRTQVLAQWKPKKGTVKKNPSIETRLALVIDPQGQVTELKAMVLSGDKKYDQSCVDAVNAAGDVPAPAPNLVSLANEGIIVVFSGKEWLRGQ